MDFDQRIRELEEEIRRTQKNKATEKHISLLLAKIAKLKREKLKMELKRGGGGGGFDVAKTGDARVALVGFPSVGKSSLLTSLTGKESKSADYAFTTVSVIPAILEYKGAKIQILDLPGIIEDASKGRGRGREVLAVVRTADLILIVVEATAAEKQLSSIIRMLHEVGIRLEKERPDVRISKRASGPMKVFNNSKLDTSTIIAVLNENGIRSADVYVGEGVEYQDLLDSLDDSLVYTKSLVVVNKIDLVDTDTIEILKSKYPKAVFVSNYIPETIQILKDRIYTEFDFIRIYTKSWKGEVSSDPLILKRGATVRDVCRAIHRELEENFKYAVVWGTSAKYPGQRVGLDHKMDDGDIIQIYDQ